LALKENVPLNELSLSLKPNRFFFLFFPFLKKKNPDSCGIGENGPKLIFEALTNNSHLKLLEICKKRFFFQAPL